MLWATTDAHARPLSLRERVELEYLVDVLAVA